MEKKIFFFKLFSEKIDAAFNKKIKIQQLQQKFENQLTCMLLRLFSSLKILRLVDFWALQAKKFKSSIKHTIIDKFLNSSNFWKRDSILTYLAVFDAVF